MPKFFVDAVSGNTVELTGPDGAHIAKSLRMREGEELTVCDAQGYDHRCTVLSVQGDRVALQVLEKKRCEAEPSLAVTLFQCLTKGEKMDTIVQKSVELGVERIVPVLSCRSISRPDEKAAVKKRERWQKIAREAAMQAGRGKIPQVAPVTGFNEAVKALSAFPGAAVCYEGGGEPLSSLMQPSPSSAALFIGPEGGIAPEEIAALKEAGGRIVTLGPRILRTETAPLAALCAILFATGNME